MKHTASKFFRALCGIDTMLIHVISIVVMLALVAGLTSVPVLAGSNGIYIATATPHYKHPVTGKIEDSGGEGSAVLGQSMTESATYKKALVEVDPQSNTYITVRLQLMDNIQNPKFQVDGSAVSASLVQEDYSNNTADYCMKVNSENSVIRCNMYVTAMGREVIFYITVSNLQSGSGDFITSVKVETPKPSESVQTQPPAQIQQPAQVQPTENNTSVQTEPPVETQAPQISVSTEAAETDPPATEVSVPEDSEKDSKDNTPVGLQEFDASGNKVENKDYEKTNQDNGGSTVIWWVLGGVVIAVASGFAVWYFCFFKKKK